MFFPIRYYYKYVKQKCLWIRICYTVFFEGHASLEDMKVVKEWAGASEENAGLLRRERKLFNAMILAGHSRRTDIQRMRNRRNYFIREFLKIASVIVITVSVTAVLFSIGKDNGGMYLAMQTITVPAGQRVNLDLPDGSNVWLNAGTTMQYPVSFMTDKREVILDGEATLRWLIMKRVRLWYIQVHWM